MTPPSIIHTHWDEKALLLLNGGDGGIPRTRLYTLQLAALQSTGGFKKGNIYPHLPSFSVGSQSTSCPFSCSLLYTQSNCQYFSSYSTENTHSRLYNLSLSPLSKSTINRFILPYFIFIFYRLSISLIHGKQTLGIEHPG